MNGIGKNYIVVGDGSVFYPITQETALLLWKHGAKEKADICCVDEYGSSYEIIDKKDIKSPTGTLCLYVGGMRDMVRDRGELFNSLDALADFIEREGALPFGLESIAKHHGWNLVSRRGSVDVTDEAGRSITFDTKTGFLHRKNFY